MTQLHFIIFKLYIKVYVYIYICTFLKQDVYAGIFIRKKLKINFNTVYLHGIEIV